MLWVAFVAATGLRGPGLEAPRHIPSLRPGKEARAERLNSEPPAANRPPPADTTGAGDTTAEPSTGESIPERRFDEDGGAYTKEEFVSFYGEAGHELWEASQPASVDVAVAVEVANWEAEKMKRSALTRLRRSAMREISKLRQAGALAAEAAANATATLAEAAAEFAGFKEWAATARAAAEDRAAAAEREAAEAQLAAEEALGGRAEAEAAALAAQDAAQEAQEAARAERVAAQARMEEWEQRRLELDRERRLLQQDVVRAQWHESRPEVVRQHAAEVWEESAHKENAAPPRVFSLVGKSASEVASLVSSVSQVTTGTEERVALNRMEWEMLE